MAGAAGFGVGQPALTQRMRRGTGTVRLRLCAGVGVSLSVWRQCRPSAARGAGSTHGSSFLTAVVFPPPGSPCLPRRNTPPTREGRGATWRAVKLQGLGAACPPGPRGTRRCQARDPWDPCPAPAPRRQRGRRGASAPTVPVPRGSQRWLCQMEPVFAPPARLVLMNWLSLLLCLRPISDETTVRCLEAVPSRTEPSTEDEPGSRSAQRVVVVEVEAAVLSLCDAGGSGCHSSDSAPLA